MVAPDRPPPPGDFVIGYAGNLGIAQGLGIVLDAAQRLQDAGVQGIIVVFALVVVAVSVIVDFINAYVDPRIRY